MIIYDRNMPVSKFTIKYALLIQNKNVQKYLNI